MLTVWFFNVNKFYTYLGKFWNTQIIMILIYALILIFRIDIQRLKDEFKVRKKVTSYLLRVI